MRSKGKINDYVGHRLQEIRKAKKLTSTEVARRAGIAPGSYSCLENGWYRMNLDNLFRILQALKAPVTDVWPRVDVLPGKVIDDDFMTKAARQAMENRPREVTLDNVFQVVSEVFGISKDKLYLTSRGWQRLAEARGACGALVEEIPTLESVSLARSLGSSLAAISEQTRDLKSRLAHDRVLANKLREARSRLAEDFPHLFRSADQPKGDTRAAATGS